MLYFSIFIAGGIGVLARFISVKSLNYLFGTAFPYGTLFVNVMGSLLFGFLSWYIVQRWSGIANIETVKIAVLTGLLGGFTTFSAFSMEMLQMLQTGQIFKAMLYACLSVLVCVIASFVGLMLAKQFV